jgi:DNA-binding NtrC family response regulator
MSDNVIGNILVVDDQENWRHGLEDILVKEGHSVKTVACFEDAEREISQDIFDIVIIDVRLEDKDVHNVQGLKLFRNIKSLKTSPKVVIITGYPNSIANGFLEKYGADALILKAPKSSHFDAQSFSEQIQNLLKKDTELNEPPKDFTC